MRVRLSRYKMVWEEKIVDVPRDLWEDSDNDLGYAAEVYDEAWAGTRYDITPWKELTNDIEYAEFEENILDE